jgi:hypothetical protein
MTRIAAAVAIVLASTLGVGAQKAPILLDVTTVQVEPTVVANPDKVKDESAAKVITDSLINALRSSNLEVGESSVRAHILLEEFSAGSTAKRLLVGFGSGRSSVAGRLIFTDASGKELANVRIHVRGNLAFSAYQGNDTQRRQATNAFDEKLIEEIARLKPRAAKAAPRPSSAASASPSAPAKPPAPEPSAVMKPAPSQPAVPAPAPAATASAPAVVAASPAAAPAPPPPSPIEAAQQANSDALRRARQYDAVGRRSDAITWYERALETMPESDPNREAVTKRLSELRGAR